MISAKCPHVNEFRATGVSYHRPFTPIGVTIHYTADDDIERSIRVLKDKGLGYHILIDRDGRAVQVAPLTHTVYHAGKSDWKGFSCNNHCLAISVVSWGLLDKRKDRYFSWNGTPIPEEQVSMARCNLMLKREIYPWHKCTKHQEDKLLNICKWLVMEGIRPEMFCGHDECAIPSGRKLDPGGSLSYTMTDLRSKLNDHDQFNKTKTMA